MKMTVTRHMFHDAFKAMERDNFSYEGLNALFEYMDDLDVELDVIALCCDFTEYRSLEAFQADYDKDKYKTLGDIEDETVVIPVTDGGFIVQAF